MVAFADTGFIASLYLKETTSVQARAAIQAAHVELPLTPLAALELRNALNRAVQRQRITAAERDALWQDVETDIADGFLVPTPVAPADLHAKARQLSVKSNRSPRCSRCQRKRGLMSCWRTRTQ